MIANPARRIGLACLVALGLGLMAPVALADERIGVMAVSLDQAREGPSGALLLDATFEFELPQVLEEAVQKGIALYFNIEFELYRTRWYWFNRRIAAESLVYRLSYSPLTRQYRLARGGLSQSFDTLEEALSLLKSVRNWKVAERANLTPREDYEAFVRMRLDVSQLPKPFQVNAITSREWSLASDWREVPLPPELAR